MHQVCLFRIMYSAILQCLPEESRRSGYVQRVWYRLRLTARLYKSHHHGLAFLKFLRRFPCSSLGAFYFNFLFLPLPLFFQEKKKKTLRPQIYPRVDIFRILACQKRDEISIFNTFSKSDKFSLYCLLALGFTRRRDSPICTMVFEGCVILLHTVEMTASLQD